jgi:hypothetical protein
LKIAINHGDTADTAKNQRERLSGFLFVSRRARRVAVVNFLKN